ncbi:DUF4328 domain-containing protein [Streptomyces sp. MS1.AVA.4]|uniref:DUF4328 domain-containing protein n=1 Tax=Streptomyces pratisoli TaxID=3139917 RepID=A0ACC6QM04_9ACTN
MPVPWPVLRSPVGLSYAVTALLGLVVVADLLIAAASLNMRLLMGRVVGDDLAVIDQAEADRADYAMAGASVLYVLALLATATVFIVWFHRVRTNAGVFAPDLQRRGAGWAIGGWFIPIGNLWIPRGVAGDVLRASQHDTYGLEPARTGLLNAWWGAWLWSLAFDRYATKAYDKAGDVEAIHDASALVMAGAGFDIVAAVLAILFVRQVTALQHAKAVGGQMGTNPAAG